MPQSRFADLLSLSLARKWICTAVKRFPTPSSVFRFPKCHFCTVEVMPPLASRPIEAAENVL
jgi:hypothetical protein